MAQPPVYGGDRLMEKVHTAILMATFNGGKHLREQIDSILSQTDKDWTLYVHDDGSTDDTHEILQEYASAHHHIIILEYAPTGGACANFLSMVEKVDADYYFFSDQDDVWLADKVRLTREEMLRQEAANPGKPIVVHTDLYVTDEKLKVINESFMRFAGIHPEFLTTFDECVIPFVTGCTMMFNSAARGVTTLPTTSAVMHDSWITLSTMSKGGLVSVLYQPLVFYRQHGTNSVGARDVKKVTIAYRIKHLQNILHLNKRIYHMLKSLGYGSRLKYFYHKYRYSKKVHALSTK